jgi:DNA-binding NtrC family response regulator
VRFPSHRLIAETPPRPREVSEVLNATTPRACRLLLLEDNDSVREATELFLSLEGFEVHSAANVSQAETLLADLRPGDIFIADYHLQGNLTGLDVLLQLRVQQRSDVPGILMSGDLQSMLRVVKTAIPRCRFLSKPVDTKLLLSAIAELGTS